MQPLFSFITKTKDHLLGATAKIAARRWIAPYGTMLDLSIDTTAKTLKVSLLLNGETEPLHLELKNYQLLEENGRTFLRIKPQDITTSRAWINELVRQFLKTESVEIPAQLIWLTRLLV